MKKHIKTCATLLLLLLFMQFTSACSVIGYYIGKAADDAHTEINYSEISTLDAYTEINIKFKNGVNWYGVFENVSADTLYLHNRKPVPMENIMEVNLPPPQGKYQYICGTIGMGLTWQCM